MKLKVVCFNTWHGGALFEDVVDFLESQDADILALQEVYNGKDPQLANQYRCFDVLKSRLGYKYGDFAPAYLDNRKEGKIVQGNAILSKFPLTPKGSVFFNEPYSDSYIDDIKNTPTSPRNLQHAVAKTTAGDINIINFQGVWDLDGDNYSKRRQNMSKVILDKIDGLPSVILTGDTNAKPTNKAMRDIEKKLKSVFGDTLITTFNMRRKTNPGYATAAVDMMFVSKNIAVLEHNVPDVDISDHLPLVVTLKI